MDTVTLFWEISSWYKQNDTLKIFCTTRMILLPISPVHHRCNAICSWVFLGWFPKTGCSKMDGWNSLNIIISANMNVEVSCMLFCMFLGVRYVSNALSTVKYYFLFPNIVEVGHTMCVILWDSVLDRWMYCRFSWLWTDMRKYVTIPEDMELN